MRRSKLWGSKTGHAADTPSFNGVLGALSLVAILPILAGLFGFMFNLAGQNNPVSGGPAMFVADARADDTKLEVATFGSGCFWCTESDFDKVDGVVSTVSGYMGGKTSNPTYKSVSSGRTGHVEVLQVTYDPTKVSYGKLLQYYWRHADVLDGGGQFCDRGNQYRPVIFAHTPEQKEQAIAGKAKLDKSGRFPRAIAVEIADASTFTRAEEYHQDYYLKNPERYKRYRYGCGRDQRLQQLWGRPATH